MKLPRYLKYKDSGVKWLGHVPEHWEIKRLKRCVRLVTEKASEQTNPIALENIESWTGRYIETDSRYEGDGVAFLAGDILFGKLRPYLAKCCVAPFSGEAVGDFHVLRPAQQAQGRFLQYLILTRSVIDVIDGSTYGAKMPRANWEFMGGIQTALPKSDECKNICNFLDVETRKIDGLIEEQQRLIELLKEKRQAVISHAVTKGLNPDAPMKPSGIDWLGDIPSHWEIERTKWLLRERDERSTSGEEEMLTVSHLTGVTPRSEKTVNMFEAETNEGYKLCRKGDLAINTLWAWMGAMGIAPVYGIVSPAYNVYVPGKRLWPAYVDSLVRMPLFAQEVTRYSKGVWSSRLRLYPEGFFTSFFPVPPIREQQQIAEFICSENARIDSLNLGAASSIELLQERRSALISAAVTGQIDVRNYRPQEAAALCP